MNEDPSELEQKPPGPTRGDSLERRQPLPACRPKPYEDDPDGPRRVRAIMDSSSFLPASEDLAFLARNETRGIRLQLDFEKPDLALQSHGIDHTIVVFGGTRIVEPCAAERAIQALRKTLDGRDASAEGTRRLRVAERVLAKSRYYDIARDFGRLIGRAGGGPADSRVVVATGGGPGIMEAANRGAFDVGAKTIGFNIVLPDEQFPNPYITPDLCFNFHYFAMRKLHFLMRARALVAFPGGFGTLDELFETLALVQTRKIQPVPIVLVGEPFWRGAFDIDYLVDEGVIEDEDRELLCYAETADEAWEGIQSWHRASGQPLFSPS